MPPDSAKTRILLAAGPIFAAKGFQQATVREICRAADCNVASINYHFGDKSQLYLQTLTTARQMREEQVPLPDWPDSITADQKLLSFIELLLNRMVAMQTEPWQVKLLLREIMQPTDAARQLIEDYFRPFLDSLMQIVDECLGERLPDHQRHQLSFSIIGQCLHYRVSGEMMQLMIPHAEYRDHFDIPSLAQHIWQFSLGGLATVRQSLVANVASHDP